MQAYVPACCWGHLLGRVATGVYESCVSYCLHTGVMLTWVGLGLVWAGGVNMRYVWNRHYLSYCRFGPKKKHLCSRTRDVALGQAAPDRHDLNEISMCSIHCAMGDGPRGLVDGLFSLSSTSRRTLYTTPRNSHSPKLPSAVYTDCC